MTNTLPALANAKPSQAFAALDPNESLSEGIGSGYGVIGYKGKVWTLRYRGQRYTFVRPDDGTPASYLDVIILRKAPTKSKSFYQAYDPSQSDGARPICASMNGITPDADVQQRQADHCAICPRNVWKTDASGRRTRDCTDYMRLAVLVMPNQTKPLLGQPLMEPVFLRIPPASLADLGTTGDNLKAQGFHYSAVVTRIKFDPNQPHPKMVFEPKQALSDQEAPVILAMREESLAKRITGEDPTGNISQPVLPAGNPAPQIAGPTQVAQAPIQTVQAADPEPSTSGLLELTPTKVETTIVAQPQPQQMAPAAQTATDTGAPQEASSEMENRIANLLKAI